METFLLYNKFLTLRLLSHHPIAFLKFIISSSISPSRKILLVPATKMSEPFLYNFAAFSQVMFPSDSIYTSGCPRSSRYLRIRAAFQWYAVQFLSGKSRINVQHQNSRNIICNFLQYLDRCTRINGNHRLNPFLCKIIKALLDMAGSFIVQGHMLSRLEIKPVQLIFRTVYHQMTVQCNICFLPKSFYKIRTICQIWNKRSIHYIYM